MEGQLCFIMQKTLAYKLVIVDGEKSLELVPEIDLSYKEVINFNVFLIFLSNYVIKISPRIL